MKPRRAPAAESDDAGNERPSKSALKREMHERQALGVQLVELGAAQLQRMALPEALHDAVVEAQRVTGHEARRRQMQYIGRLMRDADYPALRAAYDGLTGSTRASVALMHRCERLRDLLIADEAALAPFLAEHPGVDAQWLRSKLRAARQDLTAARAPRHARELYRWLHELLGAAPAQEEG
jgi:ribosome-associated protein